MHIMYGPDDSWDQLPADVSRLCSPTRLPMVTQHRDFTTRATFLAARSPLSASSPSSFLSAHGCGPKT